jgi:hypothetical protein
MVRLMGLEGGGLFERKVSFILYLDEGLGLLVFENFLHLSLFLELKLILVVLLIFI